MTSAQEMQEDDSRKRRIATDSEGSDSESSEPSNTNTPTLHTNHTTHKRVRSNHNEVERKRRNQQRERLEELRLAVPSLAAQDRASAVTVYVRAREYIHELRGRLQEMERVLGSLGVGMEALKQRHLREQLTDNVGQSTPKHLAINTQTPNSQTQQQQQVNKPKYTPIAPLPANPAFLLAEAATSLPCIERPAGSVKQPDLARSSSSSADDFLALLQARKSSLILPAEDGVFFGKRGDSIHNFLHSGLSAILEESIQSDIRCGKCARGIQNLIMVDCERCHQWYHIRCVGLEATKIPVSWLCPECKPPV